MLFFTRFVWRDFEVASGPEKLLDYKLDYNAFFGSQKILRSLTKPLSLFGLSGAPNRS